MSDITLRLDKGTPLTNQEVDDNFDNLNADKYESGDSPLFVDIDADTIQLLGGTGTQGTLSWNADEETVDLIQNGATLQLGQEVQIHCRNATGSTIANGVAVYATGTIGNSGRITVAPMIADGTIPAKYVLGITTEEIPNNQDGKVTTFGKVRGLNTTAYNDGDVLYISPDTAGALTATEPTAPDISLPVAFVIHAHANGSLFTRVTPFDENAYATAAQGSTADSALQNVSEDTSPQLGGDLDTNGNDIAFGDNDKATFGADDDLQIYHDGSNSYVKDAGTGSLVLQGASFVLLQSNESENMVRGQKNAGVDLYYDNLSKLSTTTTGVDVTGTVTADGLTVDGDVALNDQSVTIGTTANSYNELRFFDSTNTGGTTRLRSTAGVFEAYTSNAKRIDISSIGDISFYEDTGTTAKFFWDASTERLGLGTTSPATALDVNGTVTADGLDVSTLSLDVTGGESNITMSSDNVSMKLSGGASFNANSGAGVRLFGNDYAGTGASGDLFLQAGYEAGITSGEVLINTGGAERMRIDNAGNVGIGTSSPQAKLNINTAAEASVPALGSDTSFLMVGNDGSGTTNYGTMFGTLNSGNGYIQQQRFDGTATAYNLLLQPNGGNVGIGTSSPSQMLELSANNGSGVANVLRFNDADTGVSSGQTTGRIEFAENDGGNTTVSAFLEVDTVGTSGGGVMTFGTGSAGVTASERMRIDSSGNLLVGATSYQGSGGSGAKGFYAGSDGLLSSARSNATVAVLNRTTSDGAITEFRKDGTTVGSIGSEGGDTLYIGTGDTGLRFHSADRIVPHNPATNTSRDAAIDLGRSSERFKDLYLSDGLRGDTLTFSNLAGSERMRIDSSGNVLVGTTDLDLGYTDGDNGVAVSPDGWIMAARDSANAIVYLNKLNNDGTIIQMHKDGVGVGSIGTVNGDLTIGTGITTLKYVDSLNTIHPNGTGSGSDGLTSLGYSNNRFKNLYLSEGLRGDTLKFSNLAGSERMRIDSSGNLLVGTTVSPSSPVASHGYLSLSDVKQEGSNAKTITTTTQNITRPSGIGGMAMVTYFNLSGGAQQTDLVMWSSSGASVVSTTGASGLTATYGLSSGALTMVLASGSATAVVFAITA